MLDDLLSIFDDIGLPQILDWAPRRFFKTHLFWCVGYAWSWAFSSQYLTTLDYLIKFEIIMGWVMLLNVLSNLMMCIPFWHSFLHLGIATKTWLPSRRGRMVTRRGWLGPSKRYTSRVVTRRRGNVINQSMSSWRSSLPWQLQLFSLCCH